MLYRLEQTTECAWNVLYRDVRTPWLLVTRSRVKASRAPCSTMARTADDLLGLGCVVAHNSARSQVIQAIVCLRRLCEQSKY